MLSPASPAQPAQRSPGKKSIIFSMFFAHLYMEIGKMMRSKNGKIKFWISWFFMIFRWFFMIFRWFLMIFHDFSCFFFSCFFDGFWCIAMAIRAFLDVRFPKKRLAWIRTHARLRPSFSGLETVVVTTSPRPRLRVKGGHIEAMSNRTRWAFSRVAHRI